MALVHHETHAGKCALSDSGCVSSDESYLRSDDDQENIFENNRAKSDANVNPQKKSTSTPGASINNQPADKPIEQRESPCSVADSGLWNKIDLMSVSEDVLSRCCCMFEEIQKELRNVPGNSQCCDCGAPEPQWASVTLGSLVCIRCAGQHRALGVKRSRIRSLQMDSWSRPQVMRMLMSGNKQVQRVFQVAGSDFDTTSIPDRYGGEIAERYVQVLNSKCPLMSSAPSTPVLEMSDQEEGSSRHGRSRRFFPSGDSSDSLCGMEQRELSCPNRIHTYCPCTSGHRWTHLDQGRPKKMPIICSSEPALQSKNCIVSSYSRFKAVVMQLCRG